MSDESWSDVMEKERKRHAVPPVSDKVIPLHAVEDDALLPGYGDPYQAAGNPSHGSLTHLVVIMGKEGFQANGKAYRFFQYVHLDSDTDLSFTKSGQVMTLRFAGLKPVEIIVPGRNLLRICHQIHNHKIPWIRVADRDFIPADGVAGNESIITDIRIRPTISDPE